MARPKQGADPDGAVRGRSLYFGFDLERAYGDVWHAIHHRYTHDPAARRRTNRLRWVVYLTLVAVTAMVTLPLILGL